MYNPSRIDALDSKIDLVGTVLLDYVQKLKIAIDGLECIANPDIEDSPHKIAEETLYAIDSIEKPDC